MSSMASGTAVPADDGLTPMRALILEAYYALRQVRAASTIGSAEIRKWIRTRKGCGDVPSESLVLLTLAEADVPRRGTGRPRRESRVQDASAPPLFVPVRREPPKPSQPK
jgi:hypothetical protein